METTMDNPIFKRAGVSLGKKACTDNIKELILINTMKNTINNAKSIKIYPT